MTRALLDSNVLIAAAVETHDHHEPSQRLLAEHQPRTFAVASHSFAETYAILTTRAARAPFRWRAEEAWAAIEKIAELTVLVGLTHGQTYEAMSRFAAGGGLGPRLYDRLIGEAAVRNGIGCIVTWNLGHFRGLFPDLLVIDPSEYLERPPANAP